MNDDIENWLCQVTMIIEKSVGTDCYEATESAVDIVNVQVAQQIRVPVLSGQQDWGAVVDEVGPEGGFVGVLFGRSRFAERINR
jgi:hypothetical protein